MLRYSFYFSKADIYEVLFYSTVCIHNNLFLELNFLREQRDRDLFLYEPALKIFCTKALFSSVGDRDFVRVIFLYKILM